MKAVCEMRWNGMRIDTCATIIPMQTLFLAPSTCDVSFPRVEAAATTPLRDRLTVPCLSSEVGVEKLCHVQDQFRMTNASRLTNQPGEPLAYDVIDHYEHHITASRRSNSSSSKPTRHNPSNPPRSQPNLGNMQSTRPNLAAPFTDTTAQPAILFPSAYTPGTTSNFVSNETIAASLSASVIWPLLADISRWKSYYKNCADITPPADGPQLEKDRVFKFSTFGFPPLTCTVRESVPPSGKREGRLAWESDEGDVKIWHAWLVQDLPGGRVRILTQESQIGEVSLYLVSIWGEADLLVDRFSRSGAPSARIKCSSAIRIGWMGLWPRPGGKRWGLRIWRRWGFP